MRAALLVALAATGLCGCAGTLRQAPPPGSVPAGTAEPGRGPDAGRAASPAAQALLDQAGRQRRAGEFAQASATLERAIRIEPTHPAAWLELAQLRFDEGNYAQAEQMARKALNLAAEGSPAHAAATRLIAAAQGAR
jgi:Tfp pilus assembly protein PilF